MRNSRCACIALVALAGVLPVYAFDPPQSPKTMGIGKGVQDLQELAKARNKALAELPAPEDTHTIEDYRSAAERAVIAAIEQQQLGDVQTDPKELESMREKDQEKLDAMAPMVVSSKTTAPATPDGFPERVRESIADFLPIFGLSMDAVSTSDDRKSVSLKSPSWKFQYGAVNLSVAAAEPEVFKTLLDKVVEPARDEQQKALQAKIQDLDDLTYALSFGYSRSGASLEGSRHLYGRDFDSYRKLVDDLFNSTWSRATRQTLDLSDANNDFRVQFLGPLKKALENQQAEKRRRALEAGEKPPEEKTVVAIKTPMSEVRSLIESGEVSFTEEQLLNAVKKAAGLLGDVEIALSSKDYDALPTLIDNQPQLVFTLSRREPSKRVGTSGTTLSARYEMGSRNLNAVLREYRNYKSNGEDENQARLKALADIVKDSQTLSEEKLIFNATFKWIDAYDFSYPYKQTVEVNPTTGEPAMELEQTATLNLKASREFSGNLTYTRFLQSGKGDNQTGVLLPRMTLTVEKIWVQDNPTRQNRTVAKLSYVQPTVKGLSIPLTITWADHAEFLGQQDNTFGAHLGVSFKLSQ